MAWLIGMYHYSYKALVPDWLRKNLRCPSYLHNGMGHKMELVATSSCVMEVQAFGIHSLCNFDLSIGGYLSEDLCLVREAAHAHTEEEVEALFDGSVFEAPLGGNHFLCNLVLKVDEQKLGQRTHLEGTFAFVLEALGKKEFSEHALQDVDGTKPVMLGVKGMDKG